MEAERTSTFIHDVRRAVMLHDGPELTDGQLLGLFIERRDETAFAALVKRHGPMVWGVSRRLLNHQDAEDAFQATFLVLVRKAAAIAPREMLANWLYGVAHNAALHARRTAARRNARERQVTDMPEPKTVPESPWQDIQHLLDQELSRLPDHYRILIVLCDLEGKTRKDAAQQLGCPEGTLAGRLARARALLAKRLARQGVTLPAGALAALFAENVASASPPAAVISATIHAAHLLTAGKAAAAGAMSAKVAAIAQGVLTTMLISKLKAVTLVLLLLIGVSVGGLALRMQAAPNGTIQSEQRAALAPAAPPAKEPEGVEPVKGLVGIAQVVEKAVGGSTFFEIEFRLKNISDKPITVCSYLGDRPLSVRWIRPDGKTHKSKHYEWLETASIRGLIKEDFVTIPSGGMRLMFPTIRFVPPPQKPTPNPDNVAEFGRHRVTISFTNKEEGQQFGLKDVWTGTVTSNEVAFRVRKDASKGLKLTLSADKTETLMKW